MLQRILVPVDGSTTSNLALDEAFMLAKEHQAQLRIVHVVDQVSLNLESDFASDAFIEAMRKSGSAILAKAEDKAHNAGLSVETQLLERIPIEHRISDMIVDDAKQWKADLIVMGTHGRRGINHLLLGSVAEKLVRIAAVPVLLIRAR